MLLRGKSEPWSVNNISDEPIDKLLLLKSSVINMCLQWF